MFVLYWTKKIRINIKKPKFNTELVIGIDASNLRRGGGRTHLIEFLENIKNYNHEYHKIIVWGQPETLSLIIDFEGLNKKSPSLLNGGLLTRSLWQKFFLSKSARKEKCNVLLIPGGNYSGNFFPVVTMCRNMLPFEWRELFRYGISFLTVKLLLLRLFQSNSFKRSNGIIFLTEHAKKRIIQIIGTLSGAPKVIPHGLNQIFNNRPKIQKSISYYNIKYPFKIIYVSIIDEYKHQCSIIEAISNLRN